MKVKVKYEAEGEWFKLRDRQRKKFEPKVIEYDLNTDIPLVKHIETIWRLVNAQDSPEKYCIYIEEEDAYLNEESHLKAQLSRTSSKTVLAYKLSPKQRATNIIEELVIDVNDLSTLKDILFSLRYSVKDSAFAEEFIAQNGLTRLVEVTCKVTGNTQAYGLSALRGFMGYESGLETFLKNSELIDKLFFLVDTQTAPSSCRSVLELLFVLTSFDGWTLVNRSAKFTAKARGIKPYANMVQLLQSGDFDVALNTLTLMNSLLDNAPNPLKADKLINKWRDLNVEQSLKKHSTNTVPEWKTQLAMFEANLSSSVKTHHKTKTPAKHTPSELTEQLKQYEEQQPMIRLLYGELQHYQTLIQQAISQGALINPGVPIERFDAKRDALTAPISSPFRLNLRAKTDRGWRASSQVTSEPQKPSVMEKILEMPLEGEAKPFRMSAVVKAGTLPKDGSSDASKGDKKNEESADETFISKLEDSLPEVDSSPLPKVGSAVEKPSDENQEGGEKKDELEAMMPPTLPPPPPPLGGPGGRPPPPPPPPGKKGASLLQPTKPVIKPMNKMKPLHWTRIILAPKNAPNRRVTIWDSIQEIVFDRNDFENYFSAKVKEEGDGDKLAAAKAASKYTPVRVLSVKRSQAIAVMCSKLPETESLIRAIRELDSNVLERHLITALHNNMATPEELQEIKEMIHPDIILDKPEQFCLLLAEIPQLKNRLKCWEYTLSLNERLQDIGPPVISVQRASREIAKSPALRVVLGLILALGNYMNGGHPKRGQADGFQINALLKVLEIRDSSNKMTLLEYIVNLLKDLYPDALRLPDEIATVHAAAKVHLKEVAGELRKLLIETKAVKAAAGDVISHTDEADPFNNIVPPFMEEAVAKLANLRNDLLVAEKVFEELLKFFHATAENAETFFSTFSIFTNAFRAQTMKLQSRKAATGKRLGDSDDPMASIIASIRAGRARKKAAAEAEFQSSPETQQRY